MGIGGHFWTMASVLRPAEPRWEPWSTVLADPELGPVRLTGRLSRVAGARSIVVVVHGLGGQPGSGYLRRAAGAAVAAGASCLRLSLRGADRSGEDYYHAGLTADLEAALASPAVASHARVHVLGYSLGGHVALRHAAGAGDAAPRSVAAVCSPLDLAEGGRAFDERVFWAYRRHVLGSLKDIYRRVAARRPVPSPVAQVDRVRTLREFDRLVVVPRHGFEDVEHYYASQSVGPRLGALPVPSLLVAAEDDPLVPRSAIAPALPPEASRLEVRWSPRGGHVGFPPDLDLGETAPRGLEAQVLSWLLGR